jgi:hypothetical protein
VSVSAAEIHELLEGVDAQAFVSEPERDACNSFNQVVTNGEPSQKTRTPDPVHALVRG